LLSHHEGAGAFLDVHAPPPGATTVPSAAHPPNDSRCAACAGLVLAGRYQLLEPVGEGGMGSVWTAQQSEPVKRLVAVKLIKAGMDSKSVLARFEAERQALALMDHPNIAKVLDAGTTPDGRPYFVMELVKGVPITRYSDEQRLTPRQRLELFVPVCQAIQHAHQKGIIHRDIKPSNVLVAQYDGRPVPKVIDFGIAKATGQALTDSSLHTGLGAVVGTPEYMSPEQASLNNPDIDTRSDVYSLGVLLYELLAGSPPFSNKELKNAGLLEVLRVVREQEPPRPSTKLSDAEALPTLAANRGTEPARLARLLRGELDWVVMKALEKDRNRRYESANGFALDLLRYLADEPVQACPPSAWYRLRKFVRRNKGAVLAAAVVLLVLTGGIIGTSIGLVEAKAKEAEARFEAQQKEIEKDRAVTAEKAARTAEEAARSEAIEKEAKRVEAENAKADAQAQAAVARSVSGFFRLVLTQADVGRQWILLGDPRAGNDPNVTVREVLDRAARSVGSDFPGQELIEAGIRDTMGGAYLALGEFPQAQANLERALELRIAKHGTDHHEVSATRHTLARLFLEQGKYDQAAAAFQTLSAEYSARLGADHEYTLAARSGLAVVYQRQDKFGPAEELLKDVLDKATNRPKPDPETIAIIRYALAGVYLGQGKYDQAETHGRAALDGWTAARGPKHPRTMHAKNLLGYVYHKQKKYDRAEGLYKEAIAGQTAALGADHPDTLTSRQNLADLYSDQGKFARAETMLKEVLAARLVKLPADHPHTFVTRYNLGTVYYRQDRYAEAIAVYEALLRDRRKKPGDDPPVSEEIAFNLAENYREAGRLGDAVRVLDEWLPRARARYGSTDPTTRYGFRVAVRVYEVAATPAGRAVPPERAVAVLKEILAARAADLGAGDPVTLETQSALAALYWRLKRFGDSVPLFERELELRRKLPKGDPDLTLIAAFNLAVNYCDAGKVAEAAKVLDEWLPRARARLDFDDSTMDFGVAAAHFVYDRAGAFDKLEKLQRDLVAFRRKKDGAMSTRYASHLGMLGFNLLGQKKYADAEPALRECLDIRRKQEPDLWGTFSVQSMLGEALVGRGKFADAEPLLLGGYEGLRQREAKIPAESKIVLTQSLGRLVLLYKAWDKPAEAAKWQKELDAHKSPRK
jgi:tetratricopeptide (TPR) repeat protein